jgi:hypothetical protein
MHVTRGIRLQVTNEPVQCAQKTEKGLSGYTYNKQTGLVNKVCLQQPVAEVSRFAQTLAAVLEKALVRACRLPVHSLYLASIGTAYLFHLLHLFLLTPPFSRAQGELQPKLECNIAGCCLGKHYK